jgi:hypothetical protein
MSVEHHDFFYFFLPDPWPVISVVQMFFLLRGVFNIFNSLLTSLISFTKFILNYTQFHSQNISALPSRNCAMIKVAYSLCFSLQNSWWNSLFYKDLASGDDGMGRKGMSGDQLNYLWKLFCYNRNYFHFKDKIRGYRYIYKCTVYMRQNYKTYNTITGGTIMSYTRKDGCSICRHYQRILL